MNKLNGRGKYLLGLIILLIIGFAAVTTSLKLMGNISLGFKENDFDVYFSNAYLNGVQHKEFISADGKNITFQTDKLIDVSEKAILDYEIKNSSTQYDATINLNIDSVLVENEYVKVEMESDYKDDIVKASNSGKGRLIITLKKPVLEEKTLDFSIDMDANATEVDISTDPDVSIKNDKPGDYSISSTITDKNNNPIKNKPVVIVSGNGIHYTETDLEGNIYADDLAEGSQDIYIFDDNTLEEVKNMTLDQIKENASEKITITTSATGSAKGDKYQINDIFVDKTTNLDVVSILVGGSKIDKVINNGEIIEFNIDTNETTIQISGLGTKTILPGENRFELVLEDGKVITIVVNNIRPTPPTIIGGMQEFTNSKSKIISISNSGTALSDIKYYEYYLSNKEVTDFNNVTPTGTTENEVEITSEGITYVYYRTVSKNDTVSSWTHPQVIKLDYSNPTLDIISVITSSNNIAINYNAIDNYSGIKNVTCELGENNEFTKQGAIENGVCTFINLKNNNLYNYRICVDDNAGNEKVCKIGEARTKEIKNPLITFYNIPSTSGEYYLGQTAKISFDSTDVETPTYYIKSTRKGTSSMNVTRSCGSGDSPGECVNISATTQVEANVWYQIDGNINVTYSESSDEYSKIIAMVYDGYNFSNKTTGTIGKIAYAAVDLEYSNSLAPNVSNVQQAIDDLYTKLR